MIEEIAGRPKQEGYLTVRTAWHQGKFVADWLAIERSDNHGIGPTTGRTGHLLIPTGAG
jgi:hypothetical protein